MSDSSKAKIYWGGKTVHQNSDTYWNKYPLKPGEELYEVRNLQLLCAGGTTQFLILLLYF